MAEKLPSPPILVNLDPSIPDTSIFAKYTLFHYLQIKNATLISIAIFREDYKFTFLMSK